MPNHFRGHTWLGENEYKVFVYASPYEGVKDGDGNWTFRIYSPRLAEDTIIDFGGIIGDYLPERYRSDD